MQDERARARLAELGTALGPDILAVVQHLYADEQQALASAHRTTDIAYGPDPRQRLDLYLPEGEGPFPILVWVHGGGFLKGEKASPDHPFNAHVGQIAARNGFLGVVINYRLAPDHQWPRGGEDVELVVDWLRDHADRHGGDQSRIVLAGTSAGSVHIATYLKLRADPPVRGAVLLSGLYGVTPLDERDTLYYGDPALYPHRMPLAAMVDTDIPLFIVGAEFDPPRFQAEMIGLLQQRLDRHGRLPRAMIVPGHNHYSLACHLGGADSRLTDEIIAFAREQCGVSHGENR